MASEKVRPLFLKFKRYMEQRAKRFLQFLIREKLFIGILVFILLLDLSVFIIQKKKKLTLPQVTKVERMIAKTGTLTQEEVEKILSRDMRLKFISAFLGIGILTVLALGLFLDLVIFFLKREGGVLIYPTIKHSPPGWGLWDVCKVVILIVLVGHIIVIIESILIRFYPVLMRHNNLISIINASLTDIFLFFFVIYFGTRAYGERISALGFSARNFLKNCAYGIAGYVATVPVLVLTLLLIMWCVMLFKYEPPIQPVIKIFFEEEKRSIILYLSFFVSIAGPIAEELFFRGFFYQAAKKRIGVFNALMLTSVLFAVLHTNLTGFVPIMILGLLLTYLFEKTGTLVAPVCVHILHNSFMLGFTFLFKQILTRL